MNSDYLFRPRNAIKRLIEEACYKGLIPLYMDIKNIQIILFIMKKIGITVIWQ